MTMSVSAFVLSLFLALPSFAQTNSPDVDLSKYDYVDPKREVPTKALEKALTYYDVYYNKIANKNYLTVIDFTQASNSKRMYLVDMKSGKVTRYLVSHGKGSDPKHTGMAQKFSNIEGSNMSSIGMYVTGSEYNGKHGRSMRLVGLEKTNDQAMNRAIVVHGAWYVDPQYKPLGRSQGCPAVEQKYINTVVSQLKGGSVYYIWAGQN
ncbi:murein L,D-transpeptidase catalytic domain family protein [Bdellovibrio sp. 22V]|uniref:murein L,D-transpeptidase catalytic domain family protein n=1 Tax=Bdellovibrio TaxID=958 RepID=UPI002542F131|nr:murein L,D-transpeptidase catalytic domain family protein [Bdellovibrio sp. 22V]WII71994.1 murein L,D-transpeptidase catalytic domain family protein [Bdellovibrio sp. 22V]